MNTQPRLPSEVCDGVTLRGRAILRVAILTFLAGMIVFLLAACSHEKAAETAVPVKAATVHKTEIQRVVTADAVLFVPSGKFKVGMFSVCELWKVVVPVPGVWGSPGFGVFIRIFPAAVT